MMADKSAFDLNEVNETAPTGLNPAFQQLAQKNPTLPGSELQRRLLREDVVIRLTRELTHAENEMENIQDENRRSQRKFFVRLLNVADSLDRLIKQINPGNEVAASLETLRLQLLQILEDVEIIPIELEIGQPFDASLCEISRRQVRPDIQPNCILVVDQRGYLMQSKPLRRARVVISSNS